LVLKRKEANVTESKNHRYKALTLKSFNSEGWIDDTFLESYFSAEELSNRYLCFENDVVIKLTPPYTAVAIQKKFSDCVVPSQFAILRLDGKEVDAEFLALFLNSDQIKNHITISATGMTVPMIKTGSLREIEIPLPDMKRQKKIADISRLIVQERHLLYKLLSKKEAYYQALTEALIMEEEK
jgi:restriction endonuclease S subunit